MRYDLGDNPGYSEFIQKISFHMLRISLNPQRSIEYTQKFAEDSNSCDHTKRVCKQLIERICKFKADNAEPDFKNLKFAAAWLKNMNFQDQYAQAAGIALTNVLAVFLETHPEPSTETA